MSLGHVGNAERLGGHRGVVLGGSIAGLLAAKVLSHHFDEVTLIERDKLGAAPENRKGAAQGQHLHGLLCRGFQIIEELFPGIGNELRAGGAVEIDMGSEFFWHHGGGYKVQCDGAPTVLAMSRPLLEATIRQRVRAVGNIKVRDDCDVTGLVPRSDARGIRGAKIKPRTDRAEPQGEEVISADLVIDAMGRGSRSLGWLEEIGYKRPDETEIVVHVGYASRIYERRQPSTYSWKALYVLGDTRMGAVFPIEGGRWISVLGGMLHDYPPEDEDRFLAFAKSLPGPDIYNFFAQEKPLTEIYSYRFLSNLRRHYERLARMPEGFCVLGDATASFNPIYGQGMTTAAIGSDVLDASLKDARKKHGPGQLEGFSMAFQRRLGRELDVPWFFSTSEDLAKKDVQGEKPPGFAAMRAFVHGVQSLSLTDPEVVRRFYRVMHMLEPPTALLHPRVVLPLAKHGIANVREIFGSQRSSVLSQKFGE